MTFCPCRSPIPETRTDKGAHKRKTKGDIAFSTVVRQGLSRFNIGLLRLLLPWSTPRPQARFQLQTDRRLPRPRLAPEWSASRDRVPQSLCPSGVRIPFFRRHRQYMRNNAPVLTHPSTRSLGGERGKKRDSAVRIARFGVILKERDRSLRSGPVPSLPIRGMVQILGFSGNSTDRPHASTVEVLSVVGPMAGSGTLVAVKAQYV